MATILVTGGAGFIGSGVSEALLQRGDRVLIVDNFNDYYNPEYKWNNIDEIEGNMVKLNLDESMLKIFELDICEKDALDRIFASEKIDGVIHLAACAGVRPSIEDPELYTKVNIQGTVHILENLKQYGIKHFVFASSSSVYGNNKRTPFRETDIVDFPISPYAATKKGGELLCHTYYHLYQINTACLRFFTVYGPRQRPDLAIYKFTDLMLKEKPIPFYGDGSTRRDYTYIADIVDGTLKALDWTTRQPEGEAAYEIFNLGESHTVSLSEMVDVIEKTLGRKAIRNQLSNQPGDVVATYADVRKAKEILGYTPKTSFEMGIKQFVDWFLRNRSDRNEE